MSKPSEEQGRTAWAAFLMAHAAVVSRIERLMESEDRLPLSSYDVLLELAVAPKRRLRMQELSDRVVLSRSRVSRIVDALEEQGLVRRETDPTDRRASFAVITTTGRRGLREAAPTYLRGIAEHFTGHLTTDEAEVIQRAMDRIRAANEERHSGLAEQRCGGAT